MQSFHTWLPEVEQTREAQPPEHVWQMLMLEKQQHKLPLQQAEADERWGLARKWGSFPDPHSISGSSQRFQERDPSQGVRPQWGHSPGATGVHVPLHRQWDADAEYGLSVCIIVALSWDTIYKTVDDVHPGDADAAGSHCCMWRNIDRKRASASSTSQKRKAHK